MGEAKNRKEEIENLKKMSNDIERMVTESKNMDELSEKVKNKYGVKIAIYDGRASSLVNYAKEVEAHYISDPIALKCILDLEKEGQNYLDTHHLNEEEAKDWAYWMGVACVNKLIPIGEKKGYIPSFGVYKYLWDSFAASCFKTWVKDYRDCA